MPTSPYVQQLYAQMLSQPAPNQGTVYGPMNAAADIARQFVAARGLKKEQAAQDAEKAAMAQAFAQVLSPQINPVDVNLPANQQLPPEGPASAQTMQDRTMASGNTELINALAPGLMQAQAAREQSEREAATALHNVPAGATVMRGGLPMFTAPTAPEKPDTMSPERLAQEQQLIRDRAAARPQAASQERVPMGYRSKPDGTLEPIPGGPADPNALSKPERPLPPAAITSLGSIGGEVATFDRLRTGFKPEFGGNVVLGSASNTIGRIMGDSSGQAQWWQDYQALANTIRNRLFGAALTATEAAEFQKAMITPRMDPGEIAKNLQRQSALATIAARKMAKAYAASGYGTEAIEGALGMSLADIESGAASAQQSLQGGAAGALPQGVTEEDIQHTMQLHNVSREEVLRRLNAP